MTFCRSKQRRESRLVILLVVPRSRNMDGPWRTFRDFALRILLITTGASTESTTGTQLLRNAKLAMPPLGGEATCKEYSIEQKAVLGTRYSCYCYLCCKSLPVVALGDISFSLLRCSPSALEALPGHLHVLPYHAIM